MSEAAGLESNLTTTSESPQTPTSSSSLSLKHFLLSIKHHLTRPDITLHDEKIGEFINGLKRLGTRDNVGELSVSALEVLAKTILPQWEDLALSSEEEREDRPFLHMGFGAANVLSEEFLQPESNFKKNLSSSPILQQLLAVVDEELQKFPSAIPTSPPHLHSSLNNQWLEEKETARKVEEDLRNRVSYLESERNHLRSELERKLAETSTEGVEILKQVCK